MRRATTIATVVGLVLAVAGPASAATVTVTTNADTSANDGQCSLREAIAAANTDLPTGGCAAGSGVDTVRLGPDTYSLGGLGDELVITSSLTLAGAGAAVTTVQQTVGPARVIRVAAAGSPTVTITGMKITGGAPDTGSSGADANGAPGSSGQAGGSATATSGGPGSNGGALLNESTGALVVDDVNFFQNRAGYGGSAGNASGGAGGLGAVGGTATAGSAGPGGMGGAIYTVGPLTASNCTFDGNEGGPGQNGGTATGGAGGFGAPGRAGGTAYGGAGGAGGSGGAIAAETDVTIDNCAFKTNFGGGGGNGGNATGGAGGNGNASGAIGGTGAGGNGGTAGAAGAGAAIHLVSGTATLTVSDSTFDFNHSGGAGNGGTGTGGHGGQGNVNAGGLGGFGTGGAGGAAGDGTAINWPGAVHIEGSLFVYQQGNLFGANGGAGSGGSGGSGTSTGTGGGALGGAGGRAGRGAVFAGTGSSIINSTFTQNSGAFPGKGGDATGGSGGTSGAATAGNGGAGGAGGIHALGAMALTHDTIAYLNIGSSGAAGGVAHGNGSKTNGSAGAGAPSTIQSGGNTTLTASIVYYNGDGYCGGTFTDGGHNIAGQGCPGTLVDAMLVVPLAENGGPTRTLALQPGSPAIDLVPASGAGCTTVDQRGVRRPHATACDAGAYERAAPDVTVTDATGVTNTEATLNGSVAPNFRAATYTFEYGTTDAYGSSTTAKSAGSGLSAQDVSEAIAGLAPSTTYHFRVVATSDEGTTSGPDKTFTTAATPTGGSGPGGSGGPSTGAGGDTTAPIFLSASIKPKKFAVKKKGTRRGGARFLYTLSEAATVKIAIERIAPGRKVGKRCVKPTAKNRKAKPCKRYVLVKRIAAPGKVGANVKVFTGRFGKVVLKRGSYRATLTAKDAAGNAAKPKRLGFRVV